MRTLTVPELIARVEERAHQDGRPARLVSPKVARQMLYLLGDNEVWATRPEGDDMAIWSGLRDEREWVRAEFAPLFPEHAAALAAGYKHWGLDWLRLCAEAVDQ